MRRTRQLTFCSLMVALGVAIMFLFSLTEIFSLTAVLISSLCLFIVAEEIGSPRAFLVYLATGMIAVFILASKLSAAEYFIFALYPVIKRLIEKRGRGVSIILKAVYIILAVGVDMLLIQFVFPTGEDSIYVKIAIVVGSIVWLVLYDVAYTRLSAMYHYKLRHQLRIDKFFS